MSPPTCSSSSHHIIVDTFTLFPGLPPELRIKVWKLAAQVPQVISIYYQTWSPNDIYAPLTQPGMLLVNHEARQVALMERPSSFGDRLISPIHYSPQNDILFFISEASFDIFMNRSKTPPLLFHLMIHRTGLHHYFTNLFQNLTILNTLKTLRLEPPSSGPHNSMENLTPRNALEGFSKRRGFELKWMTNAEMMSLAKDH
jgi:hypothetical protein